MNAMTPAVSINIHQVREHHRVKLSDATCLLLLWRLGYRDDSETCTAAHWVTRHIECWDTLDIGTHCVLQHMCWNT